MMEIKFSHDYFKFCEKKMPFVATLLQCMKTSKQELSEWFLVYDTSYEGGRYPIPEGQLIMMIFLDENGKLFTTIRSYNPDKWIYYKQLEGMDIRLVKT